MPANPLSLRFFVDESALGLGKVLAIAREDVIHTGHPLIPEVPLGTLDPVWIPVVAARDLVLIARDRRIRTKPGELRLLRGHSLRVFWIAGKRDLSNWDTLLRMTRRWEDIESVVHDRGLGPWFMAISDTSISEIHI